MGDEVPDVLAIYHLKFGGGAADSASIGSDIVGRHDNNTLPRRHGDAARAPADGVRRHPARRDARGAARKQVKERKKSNGKNTNERSE